MPAPAVLTFTANPLAETTLNFAAAPRWGATQRATDRSFQVGGKGFNVAKMLHRLGGPVTALSFGGGPSGDACRQWLQAHAAYAWDLIPLSTATREGTVVRSPDGAETTFLGPDCVLDTAAAQAAADRLQATSAATTIALCGSLPGWDSAAYAPLRTALLERLAPERLVVDTYGPALTALVQRPLALVKINQDEFVGLAQQLNLPPDLPTVARQLAPQSWIVTDGPHAVRYFHPAVGAGDLTPPVIETISATGSGDVFLATVLAGDWRQPAAWPALLAQAIDHAARNAAHPGIAEFELPA